MNREDRQTLSSGIGLVLGALAGLWISAWLVHLGPEAAGPDSPWWALPYYITSVAVGLITWFATGLGIAVIADALSHG